LISLLIFKIGKRHFALHLKDVVRVFLAAEISPLPGAPEIVKGVINLHGNITPVLDIRRRFQIEEKPLSVHDVFILIKVSTRSFCIIAESVENSINVPEDDIKMKDSIWPGLAIVDSILSVKEEIIIINDVNKYFLPGEEIILDNSLSNYSK
jgi:purine-binding chemotaxis protein CheW